MRTILLIALMLFAGATYAQEEQHYSLKKESGKSFDELINDQESFPDQLEANYNLASHFYNKGVKLIMEMNYEASYEEKHETQEEVQMWFREAMPFAHKAHQINPKDPETLIMLIGLHFGLNEMEQCQHYKDLFAQVSQEE